MNRNLDSTSAETQYETEIALRDLVGALWAGKKWIIAAVTLFGVLALIYAINKPNIYTAQATLAPIGNGSGGNMAKLAGQLGGLASIAGIDLGGGGDQKLEIAIQTLKSRAFVTAFIRENNIEPMLMAADAWDAKTKRWHYDKSIYIEETGTWLPQKGLFSDEKPSEPTDWDLYEKFMEMLSISERQDNGMITLSIKSLSPISAQKWVEKMVADINSHMRNKDVQEAEARIRFLEEKLEQTNISEMQQVFYQIIEGETRTIMLANAQQEYIFQTIDPAVIPQEKSEPARFFLIVMTMMLAGIVSSMVVLLIYFNQSSI